MLAKLWRKCCFVRSNAVMRIFCMTAITVLFSVQFASAQTVESFVIQDLQGRVSTLETRTTQVEVSTAVNAREIASTRREMELRDQVVSLTADNRRLGDLAKRREADEVRALQREQSDLLRTVALLLDRKQQRATTSRPLTINVNANANAYSRSTSLSTSPGLRLIRSRIIGTGYMYGVRPVCPPIQIYPPPGQPISINPPVTTLPVGQPGIVPGGYLR